MTLAITGVLLAPALTAARTQTLASETPPPPRTTWGAPDLGGIWDFRSATPLERPAALADQTVFTDEQASEYEEQVQQRQAAALRTIFGDSAVGGEPWEDFGTTLGEDKRTSLIVDPADGKLPKLTPDAQAREDARRETHERPVRERMIARPRIRGPEDIGLSERCILGLNSGPPMLSSSFNNNIQVFQTRDYVVILNEMIHDARIVPLDGRPHLPPSIRLWMGDSRGRWDGDTLVIDSTNFSDKTGSFSWGLRTYGSGESLHLIERFTRIDEDTLRYEFTVDDPVTFSRPFTAVLSMKPTEGTLFEYACHEGNYRTMESILRGALAAETGESAGDAH